MHSTNSVDQLLTPAHSVALVDATRPKLSSAGLRLPSSRQCAGTNRLWGANLGKAFYDDLPGTFRAETLMELAVLSRAFLVLDDHVRDEDLTADEIAYCTAWLARITDAIESLYYDLGEDFADFRYLCVRSEEAYKGWHSRPRQSAFYWSVEKCLVFFIPYRLRLGECLIASYPERIRYLEHFFFACQLLDDFCDLEVDVRKQQQHNVFLENLEPAAWPFVLQNRQGIARSVLQCIHANLKRSDVSRGSVGSSVLMHFAMRANWWLERKIEGLGSLSLAPVAQRGFEAWEFKLDDIVTSPAGPLDVDDLRPEIMQTAWAGIHNIDRV